MGQAGDLHWERVSAGNYRTMFWANGYMYKIEKNHYYANIWYVWYKWDKWSDKKYWKKLTVGYGSSQDTLKKAKLVCTRHNLSPRAKFIFTGRLTKEDIGFRAYSMKKYINFLKFQEVDRKTGKVSYSFYRCHYMNPKEIGGLDQEQINADVYAAEQAKTIEALSKVTLKIPEDTKT